MTLYPSTTTTTNDGWWMKKASATRPDPPYEIAGSNVDCTTFPRISSGLRKMPLTWLR
jgi:hypothetical protein